MNPSAQDPKEKAPKDVMSNEARPNKADSSLAQNKAPEASIRSGTFIDHKDGTSTFSPADSTEDPNDANAFVRKKLREHPKYADSSELRDTVKDLMGYGYTPNSRYEQLYELAKATVRKRDKPEYQETMHQLADEEFAVLIVDEMLALITQKETEALQSVADSQLPWPKDVFGEVPAEDWPRINEWAKANLGYSIDRISGELMRRGWNCLKRELTERIQSLKTQQEKTE